MKIRRLFRILLASALISASASVALYFTQRNNLPVELREYLHSKSSYVLSHYYTVFSIGTCVNLLLFIASFSGLYLFWRPARVIFCGSIVMSLLTALYLGPRVETAASAVWADCYKVLLGIILCLIFTSPIKEQFASQVEKLNSTRRSEQPD
jgi:hypothetical protein